MEQYNYQNFVEDCCMWNVVAQNARGLTEPTKKDIEAQLKLIKEELQETFDDLEANDSVGVLDGYADLMVTVVGLGQLLELKGMQPMLACKATMDNNFTKYLDYNADNMELVNKTVDFYERQGIKITTNVFAGKIVFKDENNKIRKPITFVSNDLTAFTNGVEL